MRWLFTWLYYYRQRKKYQKFSQSMSNVHTYQKDRLFDYGCFNKNAFGKYEQSFLGKCVESFLWLFRKSPTKIALKQAVSKASRKRAFTDKSYSCNKPIFGKYDIQWFRTAKAIAIGIFLLTSAVSWFLWESKRGLELFF